MPDNQDPTILELGQLFAMPLTALIDADAHAASSFAEFIRTQGFEPDPEDPTNSLGRLRMISFTYDQQQPNGQVDAIRVQVPLLSLLTLPALGIQDATVHFCVNIVKPIQTDQSRLALDPSALPAPAQMPRMLARIAPTQQSPKERPATRAHMDVTVNIKQSDFPDGVIQLLNRMASGTIVATAQQNRPTLTLAPDSTNLIGVGSFTIVKATLLDTNQKPIAGQRLSLLQGQDNVFSLQSNEIITDPNGQASFSVVVVNKPPAGVTSETIFVLALVPDPLGHLTEVRANLSFNIQV